MTFSELNDLPFEGFEEGAAAGRDVGHLVGEAELLDGLGRLAAADDGHGRRVGHRLGDALRPLAERLVLELAHRAVPDDRPGRPDDLARRASIVFGPMSMPNQPSGMSGPSTTLVSAAGVGPVGDQVVDRAGPACRRPASSSWRASSSLSASTRLLPIACPWAFRKV